MPFRALVDGKIVSPSQVADHEAVECPECRGVLYPRGGDQRARHFYHPATDTTDTCSTVRGESDTHAKCAALAAAALSDQFPEADRAGTEITVNVADTPTPPETRRADALLEFESENPYFGTGLIIEVQYKHYSKDIEATTHDYLSAGYSVAWLTPDDFEAERLPYHVINDAFQNEDSRAYSVREHEPWEFETRGKEHFRWEDPSSGCPIHGAFDRHSWVRIPEYAHPDGHEYQICWWCENRRQYDQKLTRFVYDLVGVLAPNVRPEILRDAVVLDPDEADSFSEWVRTRDTDLSVFEKAFATRTEVAPCRGPVGLHEWKSPTVLDKDYRGREEVGLRKCRHCPVSLLSNFTDHGEFQSFILFGTPPDSDWILTEIRKNPRTCDHYCHLGRTHFDFCPDCGENQP